MNPTHRNVDLWRHHGQQRALAEAARDASDSYRWDLYDSYGPGPEFLGNVAGRNVIDAGSGTGQTIAHLVQERGACGVGVDNSPTMTRLATERYGTIPHLTYVNDDAARYLAQRHGTFDVCISRFGAFCFTDPHLMLAAAAMALRPGGTLVLSTMAEHADGIPASSLPVASSSSLPQEGGSARAVPRWVLTDALWRQLLDRTFDVEVLERLANPRHPRRAVATYLIRASRR
ncbi:MULTISPECIES: class I SAM-dependent methyltransferase [Streptomyces]|uniref:class I SAM-dependent methyltransferase n=1 Tax=Streptomyces TaxID=1883 RepID=UPI00163C673A|nr:MULTISPECIES: class I SAM-dependent methyltransferase [Streptomyces]MBC2879312.1 class I SAM-dependent methyltransferase [Streptomyces sp. TYQ1024]UBI40088.1 class I SAM-dependent methyltransferase [Streptomyces mobaraensis]UKW32667.1 class I SAM-dependent methyltransferase [Streptomyces sp. TYQ1024]